MNIDEREQGLMKLVVEYREQECRRILAEAESRAAELRRQTYVRQRAALHQRVIAERPRAQSMIQAADAERVTRERRRGEQRDAALAAAVWPLLEEALLSRWTAPESRERWVHLALAEAGRRLPRGGWLLRHATNWPEPERAEAARRIEQQSGPARFIADSGIAAGLIVIASGAALDMSVTGLLRDRSRVEARMLALARQGRGPSAERQGKESNGTGIDGASE